MIGLGSLAESMQAKSKRRFNLLMLEEREYYFHVRTAQRSSSRRRLRQPESPPPPPPPRHCLTRLDLVPLDCNRTTGAICTCPKKAVRQRQR